MKTIRSLSSANVFSITILMGALACAPVENADPASPGTGGSSSGSGGKSGGSGGSTSSGSGGSTSASGGSGGSTSGSGGSVSTGSGGAVGGSDGGSTGSGGSPGSGGAGVDAGAETGGSDTGGPVASGPLKITVSGLAMDAKWDVPVFPRTASNPANMSPAIAWEGMPEGTKSFAVSMIDTGTTNGMKVTPGGGTKAHWVLFDIPTTTNMLAANLPHTVTLMDPMGAKTTKFAGGTGYFGPGAGSVNIYVITIWALKVPTLGATAGAASQSVYGMLNAQSLGKASFVAVGKQGGI